MTMYATLYYYLLLRTLFCFNCIFVGVVEAIDGTDLKVKLMMRSGLDKFCWPSTPDIQHLSIDGILCVLPSAPLPCRNTVSNRRRVYAIGLANKKDIDELFDNLQ